MESRIDRTDLRIGMKLNMTFFLGLDLIFFFLGLPHSFHRMIVIAQLINIQVAHLLDSRSRNLLTPRRCANLSLRYRLRNSIQLALTLLFTFKTKRMTVSCFVFGVQYVCHHTGKAKLHVKLFEDVRKSGSAIFCACDSSLPEEEEVLGRGLFLACESNSQKRSEENQDGNSRIFRIQ